MEPEKYAEEYLLTPSNCRTLIPKLSGSLHSIIPILTPNYRKSGLLVRILKTCVNTGFQN